ncbi:DUF4148 domain-containing protein [Burkholderia multivorans]|uniref:DUF4148 domain-containing protein n=1 Tax=Burkholderia multivorans TaxID=87883 RepID=UPI001C23EB8E|nr:DUF4148 domain-containing protein [Burkholderia multivorans]MBU9369994.1 DUF4148 domain-containing protein [Burkholderia multivorans]HDR9017783.1 DUF4148 domain-containing protein [Burkholderia vietnamiensis]
MRYVNIVAITVVGAVVLFAPDVSFAQASQPLTRAQVRSELAQYRQAGYQPADWLHFPESVQQAEEVIAQRKNANASYGSPAGSTSESSD